MGTAGPRAGRCRGGPRPAPAMDDLDALLADLETTSCHLGRHPVLLPQAPAGPPDPPAGTPGTPGDPPRPPPPPCGPAPSGAPPAGGDTEQLYSTVHKARPPRGPPRSPTAPGLGELDRLLRDLDVTHCSIADEILAQFPPLKGPDGEKKAEEEEEEAEDGASPPRPSTPGPPPAPPSASSATQELDRLMASLSDFRLRSTPPPQQPAPGSLDSMLVLLQSDLSRRGVPTGSKGVCGACRKPIAGQVVTALGCAWHPEHFVCAHCQRALGGSTFFEKDGAPYCERDYFQLFAPRCGQCAQPILDKMVTALDKNWHPEHFCCVKCGRPFGEEGFLEKDGQQYCRQDFAELFASRCRGCGRPILEGYVAALEGLWHPECFVCGECLAPFAAGTFFEAGGRPYCERHAAGGRAQACRGCGEPIAGRCVTAMAQRFHPEHFVCAFCRRPLAKGPFQEQAGKAYCQPCFRRLFG
ncbi:transforming growth factor beta-1-induced transcript 1 protein isoform X2 [Dromaius novaehollandiae]|uniref:transforming growth factor beta-1-induced transcript 1 protein isoform X2 n=1 Tax=Dromaius novaehollandiae TaxID=8790 RepID=UPI00311F2035